jgi:HEAT repeat protein
VSKSFVSLAFAVATAVGAALLQGCADAPTYRGKTAAHWNRVLLDRDEQYRVEALTALAELGPDAAQAAPNVKRVIADRESNSWETRQKAVTVWWTISDNPNSDVLPRLLTWLRSPNENDAQFAAEAVSRIGTPAKQALPALRERYEAVNRKLAEMDEADRPSSSALRQSLLDAISSVNGGGKPTS